MRVNEEIPDSLLCVAAAVMLAYPLYGSDYGNNAVTGSVISKLLKRFREFFRGNYHHVHAVPLKGRELGYLQGCISILKGYPLCFSIKNQITLIGNHAFDTPLPHGSALYRFPFRNKGFIWRGGSANIHMG